MSFTYGENSAEGILGVLLSLLQPSRSSVLRICISFEYITRFKSNSVVTRDSLAYVGEAHVPDMDRVGVSYLGWWDLNRLLYLEIFYYAWGI